jgi:hypothetical protein
MSALGSIIDAAVASVISEHPKLFNPQGKERAQKVLVREILKLLVREPRDGTSNETQPDNPIAELTSADDPRAVAYCRLRELAGAVRPMTFGQGQIYLPVESNTAAVRAFAELPPQQEWLFITDRRQLTAWREFFDETLPNVSRREITAARGDAVGAQLPWCWPPSKTGKLYAAPSEEEFVA